LVSVLSLTSAADAVLVVYGNNAALRSKIVAAVTSYQGDSVVGGLRTSDGDVVTALARRFVVALKRGLMVVPAPKLLVGDLLNGATATLPRTPAAHFVSHVDFSQVQ
jgi:hypothetical protein